MAKRIALTEDERAERRRQEQQLTEQAVGQLRSSAGWQRWLTVRAQVALRRYCLIIWSRCLRVPVQHVFGIGDMSSTPAT